jgi:hypothetical protein
LRMRCSAAPGSRPISQSVSPSSFRRACQDQAARDRTPLRLWSGERTSSFVIPGLTRDPAF